MTTPFLGEIMMTGFNFAPLGWAACDGQLLPINQNQALYSLLGSAFGGDGRTTFGLPNLKGTAPVHMGNGVAIGQHGGVEEVTLNSASMPGHSHMAHTATTTADQNSPAGNIPGIASMSTYAASNTLSPMASVIMPAGGNQGHENRQPSLVINFCVALQGVYPSRS